MSAGREESQQKYTKGQGHAVGNQDSQGSVLLGSYEGPGRTGLGVSTLEESLEYVSTKSRLGGGTFLRFNASARTPGLPEPLSEKAMGRATRWPENSEH